METFEIRKSGDSFHIDGFPDAVKLLKLTGPNAKQLADLALHRSDLRFALECLEEINRASEESIVIRRALWHSAIVHFMKCFGNSKSRHRLLVHQLFPNEPEAIDTFKYFQSLRNKHIAHDENAWMQCAPSAVLNSKTAKYKIAKIICTTMTGRSLKQSNYSNLHLLITRSLAWLTNEFDRLCNTVTVELEALTYEDLFELESVQYKPPSSGDMHLTRPS